MSNKENFNTRENWNKLIRDTQKDSNWLERRDRWDSIIEESPVIAEVVDTIKKYKNDAKTLLEIGPGDGYVLYGLSKKLPDLDLTAIDISTEALHLLSSHTPKTKVTVGTMEDFDIDKEYDIILAAQVLEHSCDLLRTVINIKKHLTVGGIFIGIFPYEWGTDQQHNYNINFELLKLIWGNIGNLELLIPSVQHQSKLMVVRKNAI